MIRSALLAALALGLAAAPSRAQTTPTENPVPADTVAADGLDADSTATVIEPDADRARELYREGLSLYRDKDYEGALAKYDESLLYGESFAASAFGRGQALYQLSRLEDARNALESAVAMSRTDEAANAGEIQAAAQQWLDTVTQTIEAREATAQNQAAQEAAETAQAETTGKVNQAIEMLSSSEVSMAQATDAYALLEQARLAGYDPDQVAFYYATALVAMERGADAVPYAETALEATAGESDRSGAYILLGRAHMGAGNTDQARTAFEAITEGQAWHGWAQHYIGQLDAEGSEG